MSACPQVSLCQLFIKLSPAYVCLSPGFIMSPCPKVSLCQLFIKLSPAYVCLSPGFIMSVIHLVESSLCLLVPRFHYVSYSSS